VLKKKEKVGEESVIDQFVAEVMEMRAVASDMQRAFEAFEAKVTEEVEREQRKIWGTHPLYTKVVDLL